MTDGRRISRRDLPAVVRRATELATGDDADEELPEEEVIRIAAELGLEPRHVKQALYEGVRDEPEPTLLDRHFGPPRIVASRAVPMDADKARRAVEDYLITSEYLQLLRRQEHSMTFEPAWDTMSKIARNFRRKSEHLLAQAQLVEVNVRQLEPGWSHVRIRAVFRDDRQRTVTTGMVGGGVLGFPVGLAAATMIFGVANGVVIPEVAGVLGAAAGMAAGGGVVAAYLATLRKRYRAWRERTQIETEFVLDRLQSGDDLRPPPSPWVKKLRMKLGM